MKSGEGAIDPHPPPIWIPAFAGMTVVLERGLLRRMAGAVAEGLIDDVEADVFAPCGQKMLGDGAYHPVSNRAFVDGGYGDHAP